MTTPMIEKILLCWSSGKDSAYDGPIFKQRIPYEKGEIVLRDKRFYYCDLIPTGI
jgi:hypothetical protein